MRTINIVIGSKAYFQEQIKDFSDAVAFLDLIKISDSYLGKKQVFPDELKAKLMILRNDNYHGITAVSRGDTKYNNDIICIAGDGSIQMNLQELQTEFRRTHLISHSYFSEGLLRMPSMMNIGREKMKRPL